MPKEVKFVGAGDGGGSQVGECAGGEKPMKWADGFSVEFPTRKLFKDAGFASCGFTKTYGLPLKPEAKPCAWIVWLGDVGCPSELCIIGTEPKSVIGIDGRCDCCMAPKLLKGKLAKLDPSRC